MKNRATPRTTQNARNRMVASTAGAPYRARPGDGATPFRGAAQAAVDVVPPPPPDRRHGSRRAVRGSCTRVGLQIDGETVQLGHPRANAVDRPDARPTRAPRPALRGRRTRVL